MIKENKIKKLIIIVVCILLAILSIAVISDKVSSPEFHTSSIQALDDKKMTAMSLTTAVAVTSSAITAIPGDVATPIATQLSELTTPLLIVVCAIYLEKFLLTIIGYVSFTFLIPIACGLMIAYVLTQKELWKIFSIKLAIFAIAIFMLIPISVKITNIIETTFQESISQTFELTEEIENEAENVTEEDSNAFISFLQSIGDGVTDVLDSAKNALSVFIDAIAVLIITTCVIPVVVLFMFIWLIKMILGIDLDSQALTKLIPSKSNKKIGFKKE